MRGIVSILLNSILLHITIHFKAVYNKTYKTQLLVLLLKAFD